MAEHPLPQGEKESQSEKNGAAINPKVISRSRLMEVLNYDPETGAFTWRVVTSNRVKKGGIAGALTVRGYMQIAVDGRLFYAHRLAWLYVYGYLPKSQLDHIDGDGCNNAICNLREATMAQNCQNMSLNKKNTSGYHCVSWSKTHNKWAAYIWKDYKKKHLGLFVNANDAYRAYLKAKGVSHTFNPIPRDIVAIT